MSTNKYVYDSAEAESAAQQAEFDAQQALNTYEVTTTVSLEVQMTRVRQASHFMTACNEIDEDAVENPADILRRKGYVVDVKQTKHTIVRLLTRRE